MSARIVQTSRIQVMSDLHLEFDQSYATFMFKQTAPCLALLGDIGLTANTGYFTFLRNQLARYDKVFLVMGNHEGYQSSYVSPIFRFTSA